VPVAVSVPATLDIDVTMVEQNWAFGEITGVPRGAHGGDEF
jgi:hypothetical protein